MNLDEMPLRRANFASRTEMLAFCQGVVQFAKEKGWLIQQPSKPATKPVKPVRVRTFDSKKWKRNWYRERRERWLKDGMNWQGKPYRRAQKFNLPEGLKSYIGHGHALYMREWRKRQRHNV